MPKKFLGFPIAGALLLVASMICGPAQAVAATQPDAQAVDNELPAVPKLATPGKSPRKAIATRNRARNKSPNRQISAAALVVTIKPPSDAPDFDFQSRIAEAQALVARQPVLPGDVQVDAAGQMSRFVWVLAVGQKTGPLRIVRMDETGKNDAGLTITWPVNNFLNTKFSVTAPNNYSGNFSGDTIVFAQRRPVRANGGWEQAVYTAYAPELDTAKMRAAGLDYLQQLEHQAYNHLQSHDVRSRAAPKQTVADQIPRSMVLRLMITEHIDPLHMKYVGVEQCIHEVLITVAANRGMAYAYSRSSAGALGISQFIEDSYRMVRENYPAARLEPNFDIGMRNMRNAVIASVLHMDLELSHLPADYLKRFSESAYHLAAFLAAGYNRNPVNVVKTYRKTRTFTGGDVSFENKMYVRVQDWVGGWLKRKYDIS